MTVIATQEPLIVFTGTGSVQSTHEPTLVFTRVGIPSITHEPLLVFWATRSLIEALPPGVAVPGTGDSNGVGATAIAQGQLWPKFGSSTQQVASTAISTVSFIRMWNSDAVISGIPTGSAEIDVRLRRKGLLTSGRETRLNANVTQAAPTGTFFDVQYLNSGSWVSLGVAVSASLTGSVSSSWVTVPAVGDVTLRPVTIGNGGTVLVSNLELHLRG
jgi:hypothetical protein